MIQEDRLITDSILPIEEVVEKIVDEIIDKYDREVPGIAVGERVMTALRGLDEVAYVRFASVYRQFRDVNQFMNELQTILTKNKIKKLKKHPPKLHK